MCTYKHKIKNQLKKENVDIKLEVVNCPSTNLYVRSTLSSCDRVVVAEYQTDGMGKDGRHFISKKGGVYMTLQLNRTLDPKDATKYVILTGMAVEKVLAGYEVKSELKWPNDVLVRNKKICGILCEYACTPKTNALILGIGLNIENDITEIKDIATTLRMQAVSAKREEVVAKIIKEIFLLEKEYYEKVLESYKKISATVGKKIRVKDKVGIAIGLSEEGFLLADFDGKRETITADDVEIIND